MRRLMLALAGLAGCLMAQAGSAAPESAQTAAHTAAHTAAQANDQATTPLTRFAAVAPVQVPHTLAQRLQPCMACHGPQGRASRSGYLPRIAGKPAGYLFNQLVNFRDGRRSNTAMAGFLAHQSDDYLRDMAGYFAALDLPYAAAPPSTASPALLARGQRLVQHGDASRRLPACTACHGLDLAGALPATPGLLGLPQDYLIAQLGGWLTGSRRTTAPDCMAEISRRLSAADVSAVATWLAAQPVPTPAHPEPGAPRPAPLPCGSLGDLPR